MKRLLYLFSIILFFAPGTAYSQTGPETQWPGYRGWLASGIHDNAGLPDTFSLEGMKNIRWKIPVPGLGLSSPAIWGDRIFITTAVSKSDKDGLKTGIYGDGMPVPDSSFHEWKLICINRNDGKVIWERTACTGIPKIKRHPKSSHATPSVATDGKYAVAFFGSEGLYCYDYDGNLVWKKNFGVLKAVAWDYNAAEWEFASSPLIYNGVLVIQCDVLENSFLAAFDLATGRQLWKTERDEYPDWCTPNIYVSGDRTIIAVNGYKHRGGYDFITGKEIWRMSGGGDVPIPTPVIGKDLLYFNSAHGPSSPILAISKDATGDITLNPGQVKSRFVRWSIPRGGSYIHTMLLYRDHLYNINWNGTVECFEPETGSLIYRAKLGKAKSFVASPVASDGKIYIVDENGTVYIIKDGDTFSNPEEIPLDDICLTAPSITDGMIVFRTQRYLIAVGKN
jgi:outer membrane protein assembly factor BamB